MMLPGRATGLYVRLFHAFVPPCGRMEIKMTDIMLGGTVVPLGVMLAPMAGASDLAMRTVCRSHGVGFAVTEMVSAKAMSYGDRKTARLAAVRDGDTPLAVQLFGHDPDTMARAAYEVATSSYAYCEGVNAPAAIDINMGCPAPKIVKNGDGSALMRDPELAGRVLSACVRAVEGTGVPVTLKLRAGWRGNINAAEIARIAEAAGVSMIVVHGRTREQMYAPPVDLGIIAEVKRAVGIPVIGNGDISTASDALRMAEETGCDGVAVGRGALGNPWIFREIAAAVQGVDYTPPTAEERCVTAVWHARLLVADKGERIGTFEARKHLAWYIHGMEGAPARRDRIMRAETLPEMESIVMELTDPENKKGF